MIGQFVEVSLPDRVMLGQGPVTVPTNLLGLTPPVLANLGAVFGADQPELIGKAYYPITAVDASAVVAGTQPSGQDTFTIYPDKDEVLQVLGASPETAAQLLADQKGQAMAYLSSTDSTMPRGYEDLLTILQAQQQALFSALPQYTQDVHTKRLAARATLSEV